MNNTVEINVTKYADAKEGGNWNKQEYRQQSNSLIISNQRLTFVIEELWYRYKDTKEVFLCGRR